MSEESFGANGPKTVLTCLLHQIECIGVLQSLGSGGSENDGAIELFELIPGRLIRRIANPHDQAFAGF